MKKILVVGHHTFTNEVSDLQVTWKGEHYHLIYISSGEVALDVASELKPDVFLLNYVLPGMNGIELYDRLHAQSELVDIPALLSCVQGFNEALAEAAARRHLSLLRQHVELPDLFRLFEKLLSERKLSTAKRQVVLQGVRAS